MKNYNKIDETSLPNDGERMVPSIHKGKLMYAEHVSRYEAVSNIIKNKVVLDIASGSGYGTKILSKNAKKVYGVDINEQAIRYSKKFYPSSNIEYLLGGGEEIPLKSKSVDVVVTYETIEHIQDYRKFLDEVDRVLKEKGIAIVSTPNDLEFAEGNHFHLHEFTEGELTSLLKKKFKYIKKYYQATWKGVGIGEADFFNSEGIIEAKLENLAPIEPEQYLYFFFVCSNAPINYEVERSVTIGEHYSDRAITETNDELIRLNSELSEMTSRAKDNEAKFISLQKEYQELSGNFHAVLNSTSWKLTKPLRKLKSK